jgi:S-adenosyl-L-methionine hydrolase (adenosine-forming)
MTPIVTLLTDYGPQTEHVGALHAVLVASDPQIVRVDLAHDIPPGDVRFGAVVLSRLAARVPGAIHLAVVDPGVGTARRAVAVRLADGGALVGPNNGLLGFAARALGATAAVQLPPIPGAPATFEGRDLFAPAAARLAAGAGLEELGVAIDPTGIHAPEIPAPTIVPGRLEATVIGCDRFGNLQLAASREHAAGAGLMIGSTVEIIGGAGSSFAHVVRTFADAPIGDLVVYLDSHGHLAVAVNCGDAATRLSVRPGVELALAVTAAAAP